MKIGIVGGSDYSKIAEQLGEGDDGEQSSSFNHRRFTHCVMMTHCGMSTLHRSLNMIWKQHIVKKKKKNVQTTLNQTVDDI